MRPIDGDPGGGYDGGTGSQSNTGGTLTLTMSKTGLTANTDYEVRLLLRKDLSTDPTLTFSGTATVTGG